MCKKKIVKEKMCCLFKVLYTAEAIPSGGDHRSRLPQYQARLDQPPGQPDGLDWVTAFGT